MATFPSTFFTYQTQYPETGTRITLGNSYQWDAMPDGPDQRIFILTFEGMSYFLNVFGGIDLVKAPNRNMAVLEAFYNTVKRATSFVFYHPIYGAVNCKFNKPLIIPQGNKGGTGTLGTFDVELIEIP